MIKLIALDLDNTLLEKDNEIHPKTLRLLKECALRGIVIVIATGRLFLSAEKYAKEIGDDCKIICYNGCLVTDAMGNTVFSSHLSENIMKKIVHFSKERNLYCQFYLDHKILVEKVTEDTTIDPDLANTEAIEVGTFETYDFNPSPKAMIVTDPEAVPRVQAELAAFLHDEVYIAQSQPYLIEIMPKNINKARSLALLCQELSISQEDVMACGDNTNDSEMLRWAGTGVAMANSVEALKNVASYVCKEKRSLGVAEAIERFCL